MHPHGGVLIKLDKIMETKKYQLPKEFAEKWVAALRGGKYEQGQSYLHHYGGYCCLGVACKLAGANENELGDAAWINVNDSNPYSLKENFNWLGDIPESLKGIRKTTSDLVAILAEKNDEGRTFPQIAAWIEQNV